MSTSLKTMPAGRPFAATAGVSPAAVGNPFAYGFAYVAYFFTGS